MENEPSYNDQLERTMRSFDRLPNTIFYLRIPIDVHDDFHHFFQDCWHIKDWIANDTSNELSSTQIVEHVNQSTYLPIIQSIATVGKHYQIKSSKVPFQKTKMVETFIDNEDEGIPRQGFVMLYLDGKAYEARAVAEGAISEWNSLLKKHGLRTLQIPKGQTMFFFPEETKLE